MFGLSKFLKKTEGQLHSLQLVTGQIRFMQQAMVEKSISDELEKNYPGLLNAHGFSVYSQNNEDGIIAFIFERLRLASITFFEFGVHAKENNTLVLLLNGAKGVWFDSSLSPFKQELGDKRNLFIEDAYVSLSNLDKICAEAIRFLNISPGELDFLSMDLDGNDYWFVSRLFELGYAPKLLCLEYNAKFPLPLDIKMDYNENHRWAVDDYFGCSLQSYINLLGEKYTLIACTLSGSNCFFLRSDLCDPFKIYPPEIIYMPARYYLSPYYKGHRSSDGFLKQLK
jgi:hypothetical protein